ncbi:uncharacterized protein LOC141902692 [Tubulanus polymorphus]|uniref:uncharacterized protein LOC141902692 n=1 Tax=Tubulanus polymorphus TaxID=672921 RepID=UPI003DA43D83
MARSLFILVQLLLSTCIVLSEVEYKVVTEYRNYSFGRSGLAKGSFIVVTCKARGIPPGEAMLWYYEGKDKSGFIRETADCSLRTELSRPLGVTGLTCDKDQTRLFFDPIWSKANGRYTCIAGNKNSTIPIHVTRN